MVSFNKGHIVEYIYSIAVAAAFKITYKNKNIANVSNEEFKENDIIHSSNLHANYEIIKKELAKEFLQDKKTLKSLGTFRYVDDNTKIEIVLGKRGASKLAMDSLSAFFNEKNDSQFTGYEYSALRQIEEALRNRNFIFTQDKIKKVEIRSDGILDPTSSKADVTIIVDGKKYPVSLKSSSSTVHQTTLTLEKIQELAKTLFGVEEKDFKENIAKNADPTNPKALETIFKRLVNHVSSDGKITGAPKKTKLTNGLVHLIKKKSDNFKLIKIDESSYTELLFDSDFKKIANVFDFHLQVTKKDSYPYLRIKPVMNDVIIESKYAVVRGKTGKKLLLEIGAFMELLSDANLKSFLQDEVLKYKGHYVFSSDIENVSMKYKKLSKNLAKSKLVVDNPTNVPSYYKVLEKKTIEKILTKLNIKK